ncbi:MAG TPA: 2-dehydropantoate 2-reductase N-terminal domain-containing protein, partial [Methylobacterium sp.]|nr:2-dehydropantoate 2-reductase N-terminal domain-containing protein [Methylobacterium sp.]
MSIAIVGAGAIGGQLGVKLAHAGEQVTFIARGANLEAIKANGMRLIDEDGTAYHARDVRATNSMKEAGVHEVVMLTVKAHQVGPIAEDLRHMIGPDTIVLPLQNGIPWWYFTQGHGGEYAGTQLE